MTPSISTPRRLTTALFVITLAATLSGCGGLGVHSVPTSATGSTIHGITGTMHGGQQPIVGGTVQVYIVNNGALKGLSTAPAAATAVSDGNGNFQITSSYSCPTGSYAYIVGTGGNAGGGTNTAIALMAGLGPCPVAGASVDIDEATTVASVYALAPFMADYRHIGYTGSSTGIANAFAMINTLTNTTLGSSPGLSAPANAAIPTAEIYTLADILANCVNSVATAGQCSTLFGLALPPSGGVTATDTISAMLNIATNPSGVPGIFSQMPSSGAPFQPALLQAPSDWTLSVKLTGNNLSTPYGVAIDTSGNAWVTNETGTSVSEFSPAGAALTGTGSSYTLSGAQGLSIDPAGHIWVANTGGNNLVEFNPSGTLARSVTNTFLSAPVDIAADARNNIWVANFLINQTGGAFYLSEFTGTGVFQNALTGGGSVSSTTALAVDPSGNVWAANTTGVLTEYSKTFVQVSPNAGYTDNALQGPAGIAFDPSGNAWVSGRGGPELSGFTSAGASAGSAPIYNVLNQPAGVAVDSAGTIWVTNSTTTGSLSQFQASTGTSLAASLGSLNTPVEIAVDPSGNLWTANSGDNSVTIFVGLAAPTTTPLVARTQ